MHAKMQTEFPRDGSEAGMHTHAHVPTLTCVRSHSTPCRLVLEGFEGAGPRQSPRLAKALFIVS